MTSEWPPPGSKYFRMDFSPAAAEKLKKLVARRYPLDPWGQDKVVHDALEWLIDQWDRCGKSEHARFWLKMLKVPLLNRKAWGKLIEPYLDATSG